MTKRLAACLLLAASVAPAQSSQSCSGYFGKEDQQILESSQIADSVVLKNILNDIVSSGYAPDIQGKMAVCAFQRHWAASIGVAPPAIGPETYTPTGTPSSAPAVPASFAPTVAQQPIPMVPATAPAVTPMQNAAPNLPQQNGQTLMQAGQQMMLMGGLMDAQDQAARQAQIESAARAIALARAQSADVKDSPNEAIQLAGRAENFVRVCSSVVQQANLSQPGLNAFSCAMYIEGVMQGALKYPGSVKLLLHKSVPQKLCIAPGADTSPVRLVDIVLGFIDRNPQMKDARTADVAVLALLSQFPCR